MSPKTILIVLVLLAGGVGGANYSLRAPQLSDLVLMDAAGITREARARLGSVVSFAGQLFAAAPSDARPPVCPAGEVQFCGRSQPADTVSLTCYEGRGHESFDLSPLACLTALRELTLVSGEIEFILPLRVKDLGPLSGLRELRSLWLDHATVSDLAPLSGLIRLTKLRIHACPVHDLRPLARLLELTELELSSSEVDDLRPLAGLVNLEELDLRCTKIVDLQPLAALKNLRRLNLTATRASDLTPLLRLEHLEWLGLREENSVPLSQIRALREKFPELRITYEGSCCGGP